MKDSILLLEESNYGLRGRLVSTLTREGFEVGSVASCQEALSKLAEIKPRLIIVGEGLPIDSFEACSNLRLAIDVRFIVVCSGPGKPRFDAEGTLRPRLSTLKELEAGSSAFQRWFLLPC